MKWFLQDASFEILWNPGCACNLLCPCNWNCPRASGILAEQCGGGSSK